MVVTKVHPRHARGLWCHCNESYFWVKYLLFVTNFLVWVGSVCLMVIGVWARLEKDELNRLEGLPSDPAFFLVAVGVVIFLTTIFGCLGSVRENVSILKIFCVVMLIVFVLQSIASILAFVFIDKVDTFLLNYVRRSILYYREQDELMSSMDYIQKRFECCGSSSFVDWELNRDYNCSSTSGLGCGVPISCCRRRNTVSCGNNARRLAEEEASLNIYTSGCIGILLAMFKDHLIIIGFIAFTVGILELIAVLLAHTLIRIVVLSNLDVNSSKKYRMKGRPGGPSQLMSYPTPPTYPSTTDTDVQRTYL